MYVQREDSVVCGTKGVASAFEDQGASGEHGARGLVGGFEQHGAKAR